jgi:hypothetical protein
MSAWASINYTYMSVLCTLVEFHAKHKREDGHVPVRRFGRADRRRGISFGDVRCGCR